MKRTITILLLYSIFSILYSGQAAGQTTYNIDIIWQKASPDTGGGIRYWGFNMVGGDLNDDGYSDFISATDTTLGIGTDRVKCKIYTFNGGPVLSTTPSQIITYDSLGSYPSFCIADFNGDGINDLALGDQRGTGTNSEKGQVLVHYGTGVDLNPTPDLVIGGYGSATATSYGRAISGGDINGDGIADLIVGTPDYGELNARGRVYVYYGDTLGLHTWPDIILNGHTEAGYYENFGRSVDGTVDYNKDGYDDIIVGAYNNCGGAYAGGKVYYYMSKGAPIDTVPDGWIYGEGYEHWISCFGLSSIPVDTMGFNAMGWFGTPIWPTTNGAIGKGKCYMVPGDTTGEIMPEWTITGEDSGLGFWSSSAGYSDNDKLEDLLTGAAPAFLETGRVYLYLRRPTMNNQYDAYIQGRYSGTPGDVLGARVAPAGDVDSCGRDEFLVSNYYANNNTLGDSSNMIWLCKYTGPNGIEDENVANVENVKRVKLLQNVPNPFSRQTTIKYQVSQSGKISLKIYNISGQLVKTLVSEITDNPLRSLSAAASAQAGGEGREGSITWDGRDDKGQRVSNGVYVYRLQSASQCLTRKMILLK